MLGLLAAAWTPAAFGATASIAADPANSCGFGTGGTDAANICWLDFTGYDDTTALTAAGQTFSETIPGGYTMTFTLARTASVVPPAVAAVATPTFTGSVFGNPTNTNGPAQYAGIPGLPALYATSNVPSPSFGAPAEGIWTLTMSNIQITDSAGQAVSGWTLDAADAESTGEGEILTFTTDAGGWQILNNMPSDSPGGPPACGDSLTGVGTASVACAGSTSEPSGTSGNVGALVLSTSGAPSTVTLNVNENPNGIAFFQGQEGFAIGVNTANLTLNKSVPTRQLPTDQFTVSDTDQNGTQVASATTSGTDTTATTGSVSVLAGATYTLGEAAAGSTDLTAYGQSWTCTNATAGSTTTLPQGTGLSQTVTPAVGDDITCTLTNSFTPQPALTETKSLAAGSPNPITAAGQTLTYDFTVTDSGNTPLTGVGVTDTQTAPAGALATDPACSTLTNPAGTCSGNAVSLLPGQVATFTATYTVTQADLDNGSVADSATASGTAPDGTTVTTPASALTVPVAATLALTETKTLGPGSPAAVTTVGQTVTYDFTVTNTGNVTVSGVSVADTQAAPAGGATTPTCASLADPAGTCSGTSVTLAPGQVATFTATYTVTQADLDHGSVSDSATASGTGPSGNTTTTPASSVTVPATQSPALTETKSLAAGSPNPITASGQTLTYDFTVTNTGNVTLTGVGIADTQAAPAGALTATPACSGLTNPTATCSGNAVTLAPGQVATFTATYTTTQADLDHGSVSDSATASGTSPAGAAVTTPASTLSVPVTAAPALSLTKTLAAGSPNPITAAGQRLTYDFTVTNSGNATLSGVGVADTQIAPAGGLASTPTCASLSNPAGSCSGSSVTLAPGQSATFTASYVTTQADLDHGSVSDTATASGTAPGGTTVTSPQATLTVPATSTLALTETKTLGSGSPTTITSAGQTLTYNFTVENTGNVTLDNVGVTDTQMAPAGPLTTGPTCHGLTSPSASCSGDSVTLAPGQTAVFTATYVVTQADLDNGSVADSATATGTSAGGTTTTTPASALTVPATQSPALTETKSLAAGSPDPVTAAGQVLTYDFTVTNTGNTTLTGVGVADTQTAPAGALTTAPACQSLTNPTAACSGNAVTLAPGQTATFTATYTATQADIVQGSIDDSATASGTSPAGAAVTTPASTLSVPATATPGLSVTKGLAAGSPNPITAAGQTLTYDFTVTNLGNVTLTGVGVTDTQTAPAGALTTGPTCQSVSTGALCSGSSVTLDPGDSAMFTATYVVTQADLDHGSVADTATATGTPATGAAVSSPQATLTVPATSSPALTLVKSASSGGAAITTITAGEAVTYSFLVTNTGNVTLSGIAVDEQLFSGSGAPSAITCPETSLAPGASTTCTATYTVTQADIDTGSVTNTATASGTAPGGTLATSAPSTVTLTATQTPALTVAKSLAPSSPDPFTGAGQPLSYDFVVQNTGNVTLSDVGVVDIQAAPAGALAMTPSCIALINPSGGCTGNAVTLAPGQSAVLVAAYTTTQADLDNGSVTDTATAVGMDPTGASATSAPATLTVPAAVTPALTETKTLASQSPDPITAAGQTLTYDFTVQNTGNVTVGGVGVADTQAAPAGALATGPTCVTLTSPTATCSGNAVTLAPGQSALFTATYVVTQADLDSGAVSDSATASGTAANGATVTTPASTLTVPATRSAALSLTKALAAGSPAPFTAAGQTLTYDFTVTNTGNVTLSGVGVADTQAAPAGALTTAPACQSLTAPAGTCAGNAVTLAPGQSALFTATYVVTQADVDHGSVSDTATASGTAPDGTTATSAPATLIVAATESPALTETKTLAAGSPNPITAVGQTLTYDYTVTDTGNTTLTGVGVTDTQTAPAGALATQPACTGLTAPAGTCAGNAVTLAPGQVATFTATYVVTQTDLDNGSVADTATASGTAPDGTPVTTRPATLTVPVASAPALTETKSLAAGSPNPITTAGQTLTYDFTVTNRGNVTLTGVGVSDTQAAPAGVLTAPPACTGLATPTGTCSGSAVTLAPGQVATFTATYTVTQADLDHGSVSDSATAAGTAPDGTAVTSPASTLTVPATATPQLTLTKTATSGGAPITSATVGETVDYSFLVENSGNLTLTGVTVADTAFSGSGTLSAIACPAATLAPGADMTCTATYTVTQADVDSGSLTNTATATGTPPTGRVVTSNSSTVTLSTSPAPALMIVKTLSPGSPDPITAAGQTLEYGFAVQNTGNVTLTGVGVTDTQVAPAGALASTPTCQALAAPVAACSGNAVTLAPGQGAVFTATYVVTQADLDNGSVTDSATASGTGGGMTVTSSPAQLSVPVTSAPALTETKTLAAGSPNPITAAGQTLTYDFTVQNTGDVTLSGVGVTDTPAAPAGALATGPACQSLSGPAAACSGNAVTLAPGQTATFTATYVVTQADLDSGAVADSATASGTAPDGSTVTTPASTVTVPATQAPALTETKSLAASSPNPVTAVGQTLTYDFTVTNTGNATLTGVGVTDTQTAPAGALAQAPACQSLSGPAGACSGNSVMLAPGQVATFTATYVVTQADLDNGLVSDSATASGSGPGGAVITTPASTLTVPATQAPALTETKTLAAGSPNPITAAGQTLTYDFTVQNTGNATLDNVGVTDTQTAPAGPLATPPTCQSLAGPAGTCSGESVTLAPGQTATFTATYVVTQADLDQGSVADSATATGTTTGGVTVTTAPSDLSVPVSQAPALTETKTLAAGSPNPITAAGQTLTYDFTVQNTGNATLTGVGVTDTQTAPAGALTTPPACQSLTGPAAACSGNAVTLAPGQTATFTATYVVTQADLDQGSVADSATASGTAPGGMSVTTAPSTLTVPATQSPALTETKSLAAGSPTPVTAAGQTLTYDFTVQNTGNATLTGVGVTDAQTAPAGSLATGPTCSSLSTGVACSGNAVTLAPDETAMFTATYVVTQADLDAGVVADSATASGAGPDGTVITTPPSTLRVPATVTPSLTLAKTLAAGSPNPITAAGQTLTYDFTVQNTGTATLSGVGVTDTQADPAGALASGPACAGLTSPAATCSGDAVTLAPGQTAVFTATYVVTQTDLDAGGVSDSATASGTAPDGTALTTAPSTLTVPASSAPALTETKSLDPGSPTSVSAVGQTLTYDFTVTDSGNVTLMDVGVTDTQTAPAGALSGGPTCQGLSNPVGPCSGNAVTLAPGQTATFTATYVVTQADLDAGSVADSATASGTGPDGTSVTTAPSTLTVPATQSPSLTETKTLAAGSPDPITTAGQTLTYDYTVQNTGNTTLTGVGVTDTQAAPAGALTTGPTCSSLTDPAGTCTGNAVTLASGQTATFTATYVVTQADVEHGSIDDSATTSGTPPEGAAITTPASTLSVPATQNPTLSLTKTLAAGSPDPITTAGQTLTYDFTVANLGNVTLSGVGVTDTQTAPAGALTTVPTCSSLTDPAGTCSGNAVTLAPGQSAVFTATYVVTQADLDQGSVTDTATATGTPPAGAAVSSPPVTLTVPATASPALTLVKSASSGGAAITTVTAGEAVTYSFAVTNSGNVTLSGISVDEVLFSGSGSPSAITCPATALAPGATTTCTATYEVTQADVDTGSVTNTATVSGISPGGVLVTSAPSTVTLTAPQTPQLTVAKSLAAGSPNPITAAGQTLTYDFTVTNSGNVTLGGVGVTDTDTAPAGALAETPGCVSLASPAGTCSGNAVTLAPGQVAVFTATYVVTQADLDHGSVADMATASGTAPDGGPVTSAAVTLTVPAALTPALTETKTLDPTSPDPLTAAGQTLTYDFTVTNSGNVTLSGVGVTDTQAAPAGALTTGVTCLTLTDPAAGCSGDLTTLAPGQSALFTATYEVTQADVDAGSVTDSATASGTAPDGTAVTTPASTLTVPATRSPALTETKTLSATSPAPVVAAGQTLTYDFTVTNSGNVTLASVGVTDTQAAPAGALASGPACSSLSTPQGTCTGNAVTLAPGQSALFTATYMVTQADLDHGSVMDTATASGTAPDGTGVTSSPETLIVGATAAPALSLTKSLAAGSPDPITAAGQTLTYDFTVTNTGNTTLTGVGVSDAQTGPAGALTTGPTCQSVSSGAVCSGNSVTLAPGDSAVFTATYVTAQADLDNGSVTDTATASGTAPDGTPATTPAATLTVPVTPSPSLTETKTLAPGSPDPITAAGQTLTYDFTVTDTGNVTLTGVGVADAQTAPGGPLATGPSCTTLTSPAAACSGDTVTLTPGQVATFTATYTVTQADVENGSVADSATASGTAPDGTSVTSPVATLTVPATQTPALTLTKTLDPSSPATVTAAGQTLTYDFTATNSGNVTLVGVGVTDTSTAPTCQSVSSPAGDCSGNTVTLAPGQSALFTGTYTTTQADVDNGSVTDSATASGTTAGGAPVTSPTATLTVPATPSPAISLAKTASSAGAPITDLTAGQVIDYSFLATNTGNVTLTGVTVIETTFSGTGTLSAITCPSTTLAPGASTTCTATYTVTQADVDSGTLTNTATVSGTAPDGTVATSTPSTVTLSGTAAPAITLVKSATSNGLTAGEVIDYSFLATNTGNVTLTGVTVTETAFSGSGTLSAISCPSTTLAPGAATTCTATYTVTQADVDSGTLTNTATASGTAPDGTVATSTPSTVTLSGTAAPAITLVKSATSNGLTAGEVIDYSFLATNTGNVTLTGVTVTETAFSGSGTLSAITCPSTTLAPGASTTCTATYTVTQADVDSGTLTNTATVSGTAPDGTVATSTPSTVTLSGSPAPAITLVKSATSNGLMAGEVIDYSFLATNTGNVTLTGMTVTETAFSGTGTLSAITCPTTTLAPGAATTCTATYTVTQADVDSGTLTNTATASGTAPDGTVATSTPSTVTLSGTAAPALTVVKSLAAGSPSTITAAGQMLTDDFVVTNGGNVTLSGVGVTDTQMSPAGALATGPACQSLSTGGACSGNAVTLAPGESATFTATYTTTQADLDNGSVSDSATAAGTAPDGSPVTSAPSALTVPVASTPGLTLVKSATSDGAPITQLVAGQVINYSFLITNTGDVTLTGVTVAETAFSGTGTLSAISCPSTALTPGQSQTCTATYTVTQADVDSGALTNTATASATPPSGPPVTSSSSTEVESTVPGASLTETKSLAPGSPDPLTAAGQTLTYDFVVTNTGVVTLTDVVVHDTQAPPAGALTTPPACVSLSNPAGTCSGNAITLAPGQVATYTATYQVTQADIDHGSVTDTGMASADDPITTPPSTLSVPVAQNPALTVVKHASAGSVSTVGQQVPYTFLVTDTGNVTLHDITVADVEAAPASQSSLSAVTCPQTTLAPGASTTCTATYRVTGPDLAHGSIQDTATAQGDPPSGQAVDSAASTATVTTQAAPPAAAAAPARPAPPASGVLAETGAPWTGLVPLGLLLALGGAALRLRARRRRKPTRP